MGQDDSRLRLSLAPEGEEHRVIWGKRLSTAGIPPCTVQDSRHRGLPTIPIQLPKQEKDESEIISEQFITQEIKSVDSHN